MHKVTVKIHKYNGDTSWVDLIIHVFQTAPEADAFILGITEGVDDMFNLEVELNGREVR